MSKRATRRRVTVWIIEFVIVTAAMVGMMFAISAFCGWCFNLLGVC